MAERLERIQWVPTLDSQIVELFNGLIDVVNALSDRVEAIEELLQNAEIEEIT